MNDQLRIVCFCLLVCFTGIVNAQLSLEPGTFHFPERQKGTGSAERLFVVTNVGGEAFVVQPGKITIAGEKARNTTLNVLSYNIEADDGNWPGRFAFMLEAMREMDVDVMGLQEVIQRQHLDNQAMQIADSLGFYYYFDSVSDAGSVYRYGNAIVSRYPIEETNFRALEPLDRYRNALHAKLNVNGHVVDIYTTHLHHKGLDHHIRKEQIEDLLRFIEETSSDGFIFVTGDFNANPDWDEMKLMYDDFRDVYPLFHENHLDPEHATLNHRVGHQMRRIDYVLFHGGRPDHLVPVSADIVMDRKHDDPGMENDHFGVFASFTLLSDEADFILRKPDEPTELQPGETTDVGVVFQPRSTGHKEAVLKVHGQDAFISGDAYDATICTFPWEEKFDGTDDFSLPFGWTTNADNWYVFDSDYAGGDAPELVFWWEPVVEGTSYVKSPPMQTAQLDSMTVSFKYAVENIEDPGRYDLRLISIADEHEYMLASWEDPGDIDGTEVTIQIDSTQGVGASQLNLAWVFEGVSDQIIRWSIDDVMVDALPALTVSPDVYDFGSQQINKSSDTVAITLANAGSGVITVNPEDISIGGDDAAHFVLPEIPGQIVLEHDETAEVYLAFLPRDKGFRSATLFVGDLAAVALAGECFDPTIRELPWEEDFSALVQGGIPKGWESDTRNWETFNLNNAGGEPPEMVFWWEPQKTGRFYLVTPDIVTTGMDTLALTFKYRVRNFQDPGKYTLGVIAIAGGEEYVIHEWEDPPFIEPTELFAVVDSENHHVGSEGFRLAWVFDGITNNIVSWDIDDIHLSEPGDTPVPDVEPGTCDFGPQTTGTASEAKEVTLRNRGGGRWIVDEDNVRISGPDASEFLIDFPDQPIELGLFETAGLHVSFAPQTAGPVSATLEIDDLSVALTGWGMEPVDYFIYSDFTIVENGVPYTNVGGFREVPSYAQNGSLTATDVPGMGSFGGVVLRLDYDLELANEYTIYYMWTFPPPLDLGDYSHIVLYMKASEKISDLKVRMQDMDGYQGIDGEGYAYVDVETGWHRIKMPVSEFTVAQWAGNLPDMSNMHKIDIIFEKDVTNPSDGSLFVDLVGFTTDEEVPVAEIQEDKGHPFLMFPNPVSDRIYVEADGGGELTIYDITGRMIKQVSMMEGRTQIDVSGLERGAYMVRVKNNEHTACQTLIVH